jgi:cytochrome oxidase Cu insertion factor (SCO1/SenC/PrrC family)
MRTRVRTLTGACALLAAATVSAAALPVDRSKPPDEDRFLNAALPNVTLATTSGMHIDLASLASGRPLLFALVFTRCTGVCSPFLSAWRAADRSVTTASSVHRLVLSFDPRDTVDDMAAVARHLGAQNDPDWTFAVASPDDVRRLADAAGFWYDWDPSRQQFDHPGMLAAARDGRLVRLFVGGTVTSARLWELMREASGEFVASYPLPGRASFRCVQYDPRTGRASLDWGFALLFVPVATVGLATAILFTTGARVRRPRIAPAASGRDLPHEMV